MNYEPQKVKSAKRVSRREAKEDGEDGGEGGRSLAALLNANDLASVQLSLKVMRSA